MCERESERVRESVCKSVCGAGGRALAGEEEEAELAVLRVCV